ncbi:MAG: transcription termination/antitermination protein NusA [Ruminococcaceae bacterium]|nr:transcription termination/antitermination protein NusA [Oscillospiraceae bacterium]
MAKDQKEFFRALDLLEKEKGIPKEYMIEKIEAALLTAFKKETGSSNMKVVLNPEKFQIKVYKLLEVVDPESLTIVNEVSEDDDDVDFDFYDDGDEPFDTFDPETQIKLEDARKLSSKYNVGDFVQVEINPKAFKRIPAQTAKQVIIQGIREAERKNMISEYENKKEDVVTAEVTRIDPATGNVGLLIGKNEVTLFKNEQIPGETFKEGELIKVYVLEVKKDTPGPAVLLSRTHPGLVKRLFEIEIPEIQDGTVVIRSIAREAGSRTKIAVESRDPDVEAVGALIGSKNTRKNSVMKELRGEKIDIIKYSDDIKEYVKSALSTANVISVEMLAERSCKVIVSDDQLSLAIGVKGQNARLAAKLTGCKIDIKSSSEEKKAAFDAIMNGTAQNTTTLGEKLAEALKNKNGSEE